MPIHTPALRAFLTKWETSQTVGYIPCRKRNYTEQEQRLVRGESVIDAMRNDLSEIKGDVKTLIRGTK